MTIRAATTADLEAMADIYNEAVTTSLATFDLTPQPPSLFAERVAAARGRGLGRALYGELLGRVDADGIHACLAVIAQPNAASEALHAASGFEHRGTLREVGRKFDQWVDISWWQRLRP